MFNPNDHMTNLKGKDYLQVCWRLVWFREDHPDWGINAECVEQDENHAIFKATICDENGIQKSAGHGSETKKDFNDYLEKAETKAVGRALAMLGYGTQFAGSELDEGERIVDSPIERKQEPKAEPPKVQAKPAKQMKTLQEKALLAYGMDKAPDQFKLLMKRANCDIHTMTEEKYDQIDAWITADLKKGAA